MGHQRPDPFAGSLVLIFFGVLLPEMNVSVLGFVSGSFLQAARMHIFLHLGIDFTFNFGILQQGMRSGGQRLDKSIRVVPSVVALLARRLIEFFLNISIRFIFSSFGILLGMAGPVIATDFLQSSEGGQRRGSIVLLIRSTRHWQSSVKGNQNSN